MNKKFYWAIIFVSSVFLVSVTTPLSLTAQPVFSATYYSDYYEGKKTASGAIFYQKSDYVATNFYAFNTKLKICYQSKCVIGIVKDRCQCEIDLSKSLFQKLAPLKLGRIKVTANKIN